MYRIWPFWVMKNYVDLKGCFSGNLCRHTQPTKQKENNNNDKHRTEKRHRCSTSFVYALYENFITLKIFNTR